MAGLPSPGTIETERLTLAPLVEADVDGLHALFTDPGVRRFMWDDRVIDRETVAEICDASKRGFAALEFGLFSARLRGESNVIGVTGYWCFGEPPAPELLYAIAPTYWGQGMAYEMAYPMLEYGFEVLGLDPVRASLDPPNRASAALAVRLGFRVDEARDREDPDQLHYLLARAR